jgi:TldD protein
VRVTIDPAFLALPLRDVTAAALQAATKAGASHADVRIERLRGQNLSLRDAHLESLSDDVTIGLAVRVIADGTWGFAAGADVTTAEAVRLAREAVVVARTSSALNAEPIELADEPTYGDVTWVSSYEIDPYDVAPADKVELFAGWSRRLLAHDDVDHVDVRLQQMLENKFYTDTAGTTTTQQRIRLQPQVTATRVDPGGGFETMRTIAAPVGRGWEYLTTGYDWDGELGRLPELLVEKAKASSVEPGRYDLVVDPSNLWLTIHESIGHATELDRALGYEAAYAGTSFATLDQLGSLRYGSEVMHVTGDRTVERRRGGCHAALGHRPRRRPRRLPARPADGEAERRRPRGEPLERLCLRRFAVAGPRAADGQRLAAAGCGRTLDGRAHRRGRARHLHRR